jgi:hypothetical protein
LKNVVPPDPLSRMIVPLAVTVGIASLKIAVRSGMPGHATFTDVHVAPLVAPPGQVAGPSTVTVPRGRTFGTFPSVDWLRAEMVENPRINSAVTRPLRSGKIEAGFMGILTLYSLRSHKSRNGPWPLQGWKLILMACYQLVKMKEFACIGP